MPLSPEAEADLLGLVAKYHFDVIGHNEFDAAVDKVKADRTAQRIYKSFRVTMMQTEPGGSFWEHLPVIQHAQNRAMAAQLSVQPSYAEWVNWCESQQTESRLLGAAGPAPSQEPDAAAEGEQPQFPKTVAPVLKQSKLVIPTRHGERRKSKSPSRLKDFELTGGAAAPSGTRPRGRPQREEEDVVPDDSDEEESLPGRPVARQRKRKQPAVESAGTDAEVDSSADNSFSEDSDGTDPDDPKGKKKAKGKSKKSRKAEKRRKKKARKAPPPLNAQEQKEFEDAAGRRQQPNRQPHAQQPAQQPAQQLVKADPNEANADVGARGSTSVPPPARPSKPARDSLAGRTDQLAAGYFGFKYIGQKIFHGNWREDWMDLYCSEHLLIPAGKNNNLAAHRLICPRNADPVDPSMQPYIPAKRTVRGRKTESLLPPEGSEGGASSYHGPEFLDRTEDVESIVRCLLPVPDDDLSSQQRRDTQDERMQGDGEGSSSLQPRPPTAATRRGPPPPSSPSSFPSAFQRTGFKWQAEHCAVLCFAHHLNIAIRDGFKAMGIKFAAQMKVIPIPSIVEPAGAINPQTLDDVWPDTKDRPEENKKATAVAGGKDNAGDTGDAGDDDGEIVSGQFLGQAILTTSAEEHAPPSDERGEDDDDDELTFQTADNQVRSIDALGNGPVAIASSDGAVRGTGGDDLNLPRTGTGGVWSAVQRVEGFVVAMHRSAERQHLFRELMRKEYYNQENKAKAALPTKPNDTRWNSQLSTLRSAFNIREAIDAAIAQERDPTHVYKAFAMTEGDWRNIEQLIEFLVLSERISTSVQASGSTLADVLEYHVLMVSQLDDALRTMGDCDGARLDAQNKEDRAKKPEDAPHQMAAALRAIKLKLGKFRDLAVQNRTAVTAALMHPNHRLKLFKDDYRERQDEAEEMLKSALSELLNRGKSPSTPAMAAPEPTVGDSPLKAARMQRLARVEAMKTHDDEDVDDPVEDEIRRYIRNEAAWRNTDGTPETWWKDNEGFDRLLGLDHSGRQAGRPILQEMDETIAETKAKRRKADANRRKRMAMGL
ncbi:unnamed protein product [Tilletia laevis]|uniref:Uncharacterized protein n=1 Tax=Tilletia laevis TaxID=157183 RepID=A0A9N8MAD3_9BASI|nr:unnamed protein product [Tilletia laevis]